jgi:hypothetical protein
MTADRTVAMNSSSRQGWRKVKIGNKWRDRFEGQTQTGLIEPTNVGRWLNSNFDRAQVHLYRYFGEDHDDNFTYAGRHFEWFVERGLSESGFSEIHLLAVNALSVTVPPHVTRLVLSRDSRIESLVSECLMILQKDDPPRLWTMSATELAPFAGLYDRLNAEPGMGYVTTSKLMAARFPDIVPIRDSEVERLLGLEKSETWWNHMQAIVSEPSIRYLLSELNIPESSQTVGPLRRLDVILWMEARARKLEGLTPSDTD